MALYKLNTRDDYIVAYQVNLSDKNKDRYNCPNRMWEPLLVLTENSKGEVCLECIDDKHFGFLIADGDYIAFDEDEYVYGMDKHIFERRYTLVNDKSNFTMPSRIVKI